jgi:thiol-disulfide isomerase/thioredoxin
MSTTFRFCDNRHTFANLIYHSIVKNGFIGILPTVLFVFTNISYSQQTTYSRQEDEAFRIARNGYLESYVADSLDGLKGTVKTLNEILDKYPNTLNKSAIISTLFEAQTLIYFRESRLSAVNGIEDHGNFVDPRTSEIHRLGREVLELSSQHFDYNLVAEGLLRCDTDLGDAVEYAKKSIVLLADSNNLHMPEYYTILGDIYRKQHRLDQAINSYIAADEIIDNIPDNNYKYLNRKLFSKIRNQVQLADAYRDAGNYEKSLSLYQTLYGNNFHSETIRNSFKEVLIGTGKSPMEAEVELEKMKIFSIEASKGKMLTDTLHIPLPDLVISNTNGQVLPLSTYKGKILIINFWNGFCSPCLEEIGVFIELKKKYKNKNFEIIGIDGTFTNREDYEKIKRDYKFNYELFISNPKLNSIFEVPPIPLTLIVDANGFVKYKHRGFYGTMKEQIEMEIAYLIER